MPKTISPPAADHAARHNGAGHISNIDGKTTPEIDGETTVLGISLTVLELPIADIRPSPLNPRKTFNADYLAELAESIRQHGVMQPIEVRPMGAYFSIVMGECRWRAAHLAGRTTIPSLVRVMDDREHRERAIVENIQRRQLDPIEEAIGYRDLSQMGYTHAQIAAKVGRGQPAITKAISLLDLPANSQAKISTGELSVSQALVIKRYAASPAVADAISDVVARDKISSHTLEKGVPHEVTDVLKKDKLAREVGYETLFDWRTICEQCPFQAFIKDNYSRGYCLRPEHYNELQRAAKAQKTEADRVRADSDKAAGITANLRSLKYDSFVHIPDAAPGGCSEACECRQVVKGYQGEPVAICNDPKRYQSLKKADKERRSALLAARSEGLLQKAISSMDAAGADWEAPALERSIWLFGVNAFRSLEFEICQEAAARRGITLTERWSQYCEMPSAARAQFGPLSPLDFLYLLAEARLRQDIKRAVESAQEDQLARLEWFASAEEVQAEDVSSAPVRCAKCKTAPPARPLVGRALWDYLTCGIHVSQFGELVTPRGAYYCSDCGPGVAYCRECGCTDEAGCEGGCTWVEYDLCSACAAPQEAPAA
jgi:ParB family chromosome partitioning protein